MPNWEGSSHGVAWRLELERDRLLPGRLVSGQVTVTARGDMDARRLLVTLVGTESWQHEEVTTDGRGHTTTHTVTSSAELPRVPVELSGPLHLAAGETRTWPLQIPVPGLGPATVETTVLRVAWVVEAKLDRPGFDSGLEAPVMIAQPVALLRAGVVHVGEFALYPAADAAVDDLTAAIALDPLPLCSGAPFRGHVTLRTGHQRRLQEIRAEIRVHVEATVSSGKDEWLTAVGVDPRARPRLRWRASPGIRRRARGHRPADDRDGPRSDVRLVPPDPRDRVRPRSAPRPRRVDRDDPRALAAHLVSETGRARRRSPRPPGSGPSRRPRRPRRATRRSSRARGAWRASRAPSGEAAGRRIIGRRRGARSNAAGGRSASSRMPSRSARPTSAPTMWWAVRNGTPRRTSASARVVAVV